MNLKNFPKKLDSKTSCLRISVPENLDLALEGLIRRVLREQPKTDDIYTFAAEYFEALLQIRDKTGAKLAANELCPFHNDEDAHEMIKLAGTFPKPPPKNVKAKPEHSGRKTEPSGHVVARENSKKRSKKKKPVELLKQTTPDLIKKLSTVPEKEKKEEVEENEEYLTSDPIKELVEKELMEADLRKKKTEIVGNVQEHSKKVSESVKSAVTEEEGTEKAGKENEALIPKQGASLPVQEAVSLIKEAEVQKVESTNAEEPPVLKETTIFKEEISVSTQEEEKDTQSIEETNTQEFQTEPKVTEDIQNTEEQTNSPELTKLSQQQTHEPEKTKTEHLHTSVEEPITSTPDVQQRTTEQLETKPESTQINTEVDTNQNVQETVLEPESTSNADKKSDESDKIENEINSESLKEAQQEETASETPLVDEKSEEEIKPQNTEKMEEKKTEEIPVVEETETKEKEEKVEGRNNEPEILKEREVKEKYDKVIEEVKKVVTEEDTDGKDVKKEEKVVDEGNKVKKVTEEEQKVVEKTKQLLEEVEKVVEDEKIGKEHQEEEKDIKEEDGVVEEGDKTIKKEQKIVEGDNALKEEQKVVEEVEKAQNEEQNVVEEVDKTQKEEQKGVEEGDKAQKEKQKVQKEDKAQNKEQRVVEGDKALEEDQKGVIRDKNLKEEPSVVEIFEKLMQEHSVFENTEEVAEEVTQTVENEKKNKRSQQLNQHLVDDNKAFEEKNEVSEEKNTEFIVESEYLIQSDILKKEYKIDKDKETPGTEDQEVSDNILEKKGTVFQVQNGEELIPKTIPSTKEIDFRSNTEMETSENIEEGDNAMQTDGNILKEDIETEETQNENLMQSRSPESEYRRLFEPLEDPLELCSDEEIDEIPTRSIIEEQIENSLEYSNTSDAEELYTVIDLTDSPKENINNQETQDELEPIQPKDPEELFSVVDVDHIPAKQTPEETTVLNPEKQPETDQHTPTAPDTDHRVTVEEVDTTLWDIGEVHIKTIQTHYYNTLQVPGTATKEYRMQSVATPIPDILQAPTPYTSTAETGVVTPTSASPEYSRVSDSEDDLLTPRSRYSLNLSEPSYQSYQSATGMYLHGERQCSSTEKEIPVITIDDDSDDLNEQSDVHSIVGTVPRSPRDTEERNEESGLQSTEKPKSPSKSHDTTTKRSQGGEVPFISVEVNTVIETQINENVKEVPEMEVQIATRINIQNDKGTESGPAEDSEAPPGKSQKKVDLKSGSERDVRRESDSTETSGKDNSTGDSDSISSAVTEIKRTDSGKRNLGSTKGLLATQSLDFGKRNPLVKTRSLSSFRHGVTDFEVWSTIEKELEDAATKIQSKFRGYKTRKKLQRENAVQITTEESSASTTPVETEPREVLQQSTGEFHDSIVLSDHPR